MPHRLTRCEKLHPITDSERVRDAQREPRQSCSFPVSCRAPITDDSWLSTAAVSPSGFCSFGRGSDSSDALKTRSLPPSSLLLLFFLLSSQTRHLVLSRLHLAIGGLSLTPIPLIHPTSRTSCYLAVLLQSVTIYNLAFARLSLSFASFLHFYLLLQVPAGILGRQKQATHWISVRFARRGSAFVAFSF